MTVAVLAPGPSLAQTFDRDFPGVRIGVNRAAMFAQCDYWTALDLPFLLAHGDKPLGSPRLFTTSATRDSLARRQHPLAERVSHVAEELWSFAPQSLSWTLFSATSALVLAAYLGAAEIVVYGADWRAEAADYDGVNVAENRTASRFEMERGIWVKVTEWMKGRGTVVSRVGVGN